MGEAGSAMAMELGEGAMGADPCCRRWKKGDAMGRELPALALNQRRGGEKKWRVGEGKERGGLPFIELELWTCQVALSSGGGKMLTLGGHFWHFLLVFGPWSL